MKELSLWDILKNMGFMEKIHPISNRQHFINKVLRALGFEPRYFAKTDRDWLVHITYDGKIVDVFGIDIWYTQMQIDKETVFDARRFDNQDLLDLIPDNLVKSN